jgi:hypothetical protein
VALVPWKFRTLVPAGRDLGPGGQGADGRDQGARRPAAALRSRADGSGSFRIGTNSMSRPQSQPRNRSRSPGNGDGQRPNAARIRLSPHIESDYRRPERTGYWYVTLCLLPDGAASSIVSHWILETRLEIKIEKSSPTWSPVTESNRRPSPYHGVPIDSRARHFGDRPGQKLYFNSVERGSGQFAPDAISQIPPNRSWRRSSCPTPVSPNPISVRYVLAPGMPGAPARSAACRSWSRDDDDARVDVSAHG